MTGTPGHRSGHPSHPDRARLAPVAPPETPHHSPRRPGPIRPARSRRNEVRRRPVPGRVIGAARFRGRVQFSPPRGGVLVARPLERGVGRHRVQRGERALAPHHPGRRPQRPRQPTTVNRQRPPRRPRPRRPTHPLRQLSRPARTSRSLSRLTPTGEIRHNPPERGRATPAQTMGSPQAGRVMPGRWTRRGVLHDGFRMSDHRTAAGTTRG